MSNVDNDDLQAMEEILKKNPIHVPTMEEIRADSARLRRELLKDGFIDTTARLNQGELEEVEASARRGSLTSPLKTLALINTIHALSRRIVKRFNETAEARQDAAAARERAAEAEQRAAEAEQRAAQAREVSRYTNQKIEEYRRNTRGQVQALNQIRRGFGIDPGEDLYSALVRKVGGLQTSEAELVSKPLKARVQELSEEVGEWRRVGDLINRAVRFNDQGVFTGVEDFTMLIEVIDTVRRLKDG